MAIPSLAVVIVLPEHADADAGALEVGVGDELAGEPSSGPLAPDAPPPPHPAVSAEKRSKDANAAFTR